MRSMTRLLVALQLFASLAPQPMARAADMPTIASMGRGDELHIHVVSTGCFFFDERAILIRDGAQTITKIRARSSNPAPTPEGPGAGAAQIEVIKLSEWDLANLDQLLTFWRSEPGNRCTSSHRFELTWRVDGVEILREELVDGACNRGLDDAYLSLGVVQ